MCLKLMEIMINCSFYAIKIVMQCQDLLTGQNIFVMLDLEHPMTWLW